MKHLLTHVPGNVKGAFDKNVIRPPVDEETYTAV